MDYFSGKDKFIFARCSQATNKLMDLPGADYQQTHNLATHSPDMELYYDLIEDDEYEEVPSNMTDFQSFVEQYTAIFMGRFNSAYDHVEPEHSCEIESYNFLKFENCDYESKRGGDFVKYLAEVCFTMTPESVGGDVDETIHLEIYVYISDECMED